MSDGKTITEEQVHSAVDFLCYKAPEMIKDAKERKVISENTMKAVKSTIFLHATGTNAEREAAALESDEYRNVSTAYADACGHEEYVKMLIEAARLKIEVWRTAEATKRTTKF